jgi:hypothetical protein
MFMPEHLHLVIDPRQPTYLQETAPQWLGRLTSDGSAPRAAAVWETI